MIITGKLVSVRREYKFFLPRVTGLIMTDDGNVARVLFKLGTSLRGIQQAKGKTVLTAGKVKADGALAVRKVAITNKVMHAFAS